MTATRVCFDTSAWNALLNREQEHDLPSLEQWFTRIERGQAILLVPGVVITEVACGPDPKQVVGFKQTLLQPYIEQLDIITTIAIHAGELRRKVLDDGMKLHALDALIIAAAQHHRADCLITCDAKHIVRMHGKYGLAMKIGLPRTGLPNETMPLQFDD